MWGELADWTIVAQAEGGAGGPSGLLSMLPAFAMIGLAFYFMLIRPQKRQEAERKARIASLKKNDRVLTTGGIYGKVANVRPEADEVTIVVDENSNTKLRMTLNSIVHVLGDEPSPAADESK